MSVHVIKSGQAGEALSAGQCGALQKHRVTHAKGVLLPVVEMVTAISSKPQAQTKRAVQLAHQEETVSTTLSHSPLSTPLVVEQPLLEPTLPENFEDLPEQVKEYLREESPLSGELSQILSQIEGRPVQLKVSHLDILWLCLKLYQLLQKDRDQEKVVRLEERANQKRHTLATSANYHDQGNWLCGTAVVGGLLKLVAGAAPILGQMKGDKILGFFRDKLGFDSLRGYEDGIGRDGVFKSFSKTVHALAETQDNVGRIRTTFDEGERVLSNHGAQLAKDDTDECSRSLDQLRDHMRGIESYLTQLIQNVNDTSRKINS